MEHLLKSGIWKQKQWPMKSNPKTNVHHWLGQLMVKHCLLVLLTNKSEYSKSNNAKLINKTTIKEEYLTSLRETNLFLYGRLTFTLLVFVVSKKKNKKFIYTVISTMASENKSSNDFR